MARGRTAEEGERANGVLKFDDSSGLIVQMHLQTNAKNTVATNNCNGTTNAHHEIDLPINSPRSENRTAQLAIHVLNSGVILDLKWAVHHRYNLRERVSLLKGHVDYVVGDLELREKKKLGHWMFFFYRVCLFLGVFKICATGWFGSTIERAESG